MPERERAERGTAARGRRARPHSPLACTSCLSALSPSVNRPAVRFLPFCKPFKGTTSPPGSLALPVLGPWPFEAAMLGLCPLFQNQPFPCQHPQAQRSPRPPTMKAERDSHTGLLLPHHLHAALAVSPGSITQSCPTLCDPLDCSRQGPLSMEFSRQEYWSRQSCPPPGDLPNPGIEPLSPALQADSSLLSHQGNTFINSLVTTKGQYLARLTGQSSSCRNRQKAQLHGGALSKGTLELETLVHQTSSQPAPSLAGSEQLIILIMLRAWLSPL